MGDFISMMRKNLTLQNTGFWLVITYVIGILSYFRTLTNTITKISKLEIENKVDNNTEVNKQISDLKVYRENQILKVRIATFIFASFLVELRMKLIGYHYHQISPFLVE